MNSPNSPDTLQKAVDLLLQGTPEILDIEAMGEQASERDAARLRAYGRIAFAVAKQKNRPVAGSDKISDVVRQLTFPIAIAPLKNVHAEAAQARLESDKESVKKLRSLAKSSAFDPTIYNQLADVLREIARVRGIPIEAGATPVEMFERIRPFLEIHGLSLKPRLQ